MPSETASLGPAACGGLPRPLRRLLHVLPSRRAPELGTGRHHPRGRCTWLRITLLRSGFRSSERGRVLRYPRVATDLSSLSRFIREPMHKLLNLMNVSVLSRVLRVCRDVTLSVAVLRVCSAVTRCVVASVSLIFSWLINAHAALAHAAATGGT